MTTPSSAGAQWTGWPKRRAKGWRTARENLAHLVEEGSFVEIGRAAVAAPPRGAEAPHRRLISDRVVTGLELSLPL